MGSAYRDDFYAWTREQADALRQAAELRLNLPVDWKHLAEEVEDLGSEQAHAVESAFVRILEHLLKLGCSPATEPRAKWRQSVRTQRLEVERRLKRSPGLKSQLGELFVAAWPDARTLAAASLTDYDGLPEITLPEACPYTMEQARNPEFWP